MGRGMASLRGAGQVIYKRLSETGSADLCAQWLDGADRAARDDRAALRGDTVLGRGIRAPPMRNNGSPAGQRRTGGLRGWEKRGP